MSYFIAIGFVVVVFALLGCAFVFFKIFEKALSQSGETQRNIEEALVRNRMESRQSTQLLIEDLQARLGSLQTSTETKLDLIRKEVDNKLLETVSKNFEGFNAVTKRLEELQSVTGQVISLSQGVRDLSRILESPKLRGIAGEFQLGEMLRQVLPSDTFEEQYAIEGKSRESVDAVIKLREGLLCIDSKFPLNNARELFAPERVEEELKVLRRAFAQDVKSMVDSISTKYIVPEKTLDFAFMFIPAESVYYELIKDSDLHQYCLKKHVVPVSPNSFYAYLQAIAVGFRGLKIQAEAKKIEGTLIRLKNDFEKFGADFNKVGKHLRDAQTQFNNVEARIEKFGAVIDRLGLENHEKPAFERPQIEAPHGPVS